MPLFSQESDGEISGSSKCLPSSMSLRGTLPVDMCAGSIPGEELGDACALGLPFGIDGCME